MEKGKLDSGSDPRRLLRRLPAGTRVRACLLIVDASSGLEVPEGTQGVVQSSEGALVRVTFLHNADTTSTTEPASVLGTIHTLVANLDPVEGVECPRCEGSGVVESKHVSGTCPTCKGVGRALAYKTIAEARAAYEADPAAFGGGMILDPSEADTEPAPAADASSRRYRGWRSHGETFVYVFDAPSDWDPQAFAAKAPAGFLGAIPPHAPFEPLALRLELAKHSPTGFEWGYAGSGPAQLSLAILADHFRADAAWDDPDAERTVGSERRPHTRGEARALKLYQAFKGLMGRLDGDAWELTGADVDLAIDCAEHISTTGYREPASKMLDSIARAAVARVSLAGGPCSSCGHALEAHERPGKVVDASFAGPCTGKIGVNAAGEVACSCKSYRPWPAHVPVQPCADDPYGRFEGMPSHIGTLHRWVKNPEPIRKMPAAERLDKMRKLVDLSNRAARTYAAAAKDSSAPPVVMMAAMLRDYSEQVGGWAFDESDEDTATRLARAAELMATAAVELEAIARMGKGKN